MGLWLDADSSVAGLCDAKVEVLGCGREFRGPIRTRRATWRVMNNIETNVYDVQTDLKELPSNLYSCLAALILSVVQAHCDYPLCVCVSSTKLPTII